MRSLPRRVVAIGLGLLLLASLAPLVAAATLPDEASVAAAETSALDKINDQRVAHGLVRLRLDSRLATIARERAVYMADNDLLSHEHEGGKMVWDLMTEAGITWYGAGEIIAYNTTSSLVGSATTAVNGWLDSPPHRSIMLSTGYNYIGMGLAVSPVTGRRYWAGVFMKGPDRTAAWAKLGSTSKHIVSASKVRVTLRWSGADARLQVLTSGLHYFQTQRRVDGGPWVDYPLTTSTSTVRTWSRGHTIDFRVRARDKQGNWGAWHTTTVRT
jgi:uncharacterized protein YkwD